MTVSRVRQSIIIAVCLSAALTACASPKEPSQGQGAERVGHVSTPDYEQRVRLAEAAREAGNPKGAVELYSALSAERPGDSDVQIGHARALLAAGATYEAIAQFRTAAKRSDTAAAAATGLGRAHLQLKEPQKALAYFDEALNLTPRDVVAHNARGVALDLLARPTAAQAAYARAIDLVPSFVDARANLALSYALAGQSDQAVAILKQLAQRSDATARVRQNLALALGLAGQKVRARRWTRVDLGPRKARINLAFFDHLRDLETQEARVAALLGAGAGGAGETVNLPRDVRYDIETQLARLNLAPGAVDGKVDARTRDAVRAFQQMAGLAINGVLSRRLLADLKAADDRVANMPAQTGEPTP